MVSIAVNGCCGRMGKRIIELAQLDPHVKIVGAVEKKGHPQIGDELGSVKVSDDLSCFKEADVIIDFTAPQVSMEILDLARRFKKAVVIGTTGLDMEQINRIEQAGKEIPVIFSPNMSIGVNILFKLVKEAAAKLLGYKVNIVEAHHVHKKDAPSGTAKKLAKLIEGQTGRAVDDIQAIREGEIIGDHKVRFESDVDVLEFSHSAKTRDIFVKGAIEAAKWLAGKKNGFYNMNDVIGLK
ncbi:MAG: 4-hydroxy-tetrahydrodipicolinate reductase [Candidatus Omnitrophica bacterium]|nr:4-hydroxy-tetrahydrodipicolinate reductase [Candidatus Omnitrophota bacterium]